MPAPRCGSRTRRCPSRSRRTSCSRSRREVGSDVPFFVSGRETALARGRGELLEPCPVARARLGRRRPGRESRSAPPRSTRATAPRAGRARARRRRCRPRPFASADVDAARGARRERPRRSRPRQLCPPIAALRARLPGARRAGRERERLGLGGVRPVRRRRSAARAACERLAGSVPWIGRRPV